MIEANVLYVKANPLFCVQWTDGSTTAWRLRYLQNGRSLPSVPVPSVLSLLVFAHSLRRSKRRSLSPECPNGGFPISWARQAADTMEPISGKLILPSGYFWISPFATLLPNERPTQDTSRLCVSRLCTKILPGRGIPVSCFVVFGKGMRKLNGHNLVGNQFSHVSARDTLPSQNACRIIAGSSS